MRTKRQLHFEYLWDGLVHLDDGTIWRLADPSHQHDVTWWQTGESIALDRNRDAIMLRNLSRAEAVPLESAVAELELAA